jgi:hypothetical protein
MLVVAMFAEVVVVVIAADAMSVVVADAKLSEVTEATAVTEETVETVVSVPDATAIAFVLPTGALYVQEVAGVARTTVVIVPDV